MSTITTAVASGGYFISGCLAIVASQVLGGPLYLMNEDWYNAWIAFTKQSFGLLTTTLTQCWAPTIIRVSGDRSVRGQLMKTGEGNLLCNFPERLILIANHQIYTDWLYMWWIAYANGMHGRIYIILKESLKKIPVIGWGMQLSQFIFLKRNWEKDKPHLAEHLQKLNKPSDPMWLLLFPEGTNLAPDTRQRSAAWAAKQGIEDMHHLLLPRHTGLQFCLQQLKSTVPYIYDCTIAYEGVKHGEYAQDIFTIQAAYLEGKPPKSVNMYWRRFPVSTIPVNDEKAFEHWLRARWNEKDILLNGFLRTGRFPADIGAHKTKDGKIVRGSGHIESEIKAVRWYEFLQVFAPVGAIAMILYTFYGALPEGMLNIVDKDSMTEKLEMIQKNLVTASSLGKQFLTASNGDSINSQVKATLANTQRIAAKHGINPKTLINGNSTLQPARITAAPQRPHAVRKVVVLPKAPAPPKLPVKKPPTVQKPLSVRKPEVHQKSPVTQKSPAKPALKLPPRNNSTIPTVPKPSKPIQGNRPAVPKVVQKQEATNASKKPEAKKMAATSQAAIPTQKPLAKNVAAKASSPAVQKPHNASNFHNASNPAIKQMVAKPKLITAAVPVPKKQKVATKKV